MNNNPSINLRLAKGTVVRDRFVVQDALIYSRRGILYGAIDRMFSDAIRSHQVALLIVHADVVRDDRELANFKRDVAALIALGHQNILNVRDLDRDGDLHFLTLEFIDGVSLATILDVLRPQVLADDDIFAVIKGIGAALEQAHSKGIVHQDLCLDNVLVTMGQEVKLLFIPQCYKPSSRSTDPRDDVYGLACIAYALFAGEPAFASQAAFQSDWRDIEPKFIQHLRGSQQAALHAALASREKRTRTVSQFLAEFAVPAVPTAYPRPATAARRWLARAAAAASLVIFVGTGYMLGRGGAEDAPRALTADADGSQLPAPVRGDSISPHSLSDADSSIADLGGTNDPAPSEAGFALDNVTEGTGL